MRIKNITQVNFGYLTNDVTGPKVEITLEGRPDEIKTRQLVGLEVKIVPKDNYVKSIKVNGESYTAAYNTLAESFGIGPGKSNKRESLDPDKLFIKNIYYNKEKGITVVIFEDGVKIVKKLSEGDIFDLRTAAALAIVERMYGSKTKFNKTVEKIAVDQVAKSKKKTEKKVGDN